MHKTLEDKQIVARPSLPSSSSEVKMTVEHGKLAGRRKRTLSSSSEPPPLIKHSPIQFKSSELVELKETSAEKPKKRKSLKDPSRQLRGLDLLKAGDQIRRKSRSLHEGNQVICSSIPEFCIPSVSKTPQSPQLTALMDEYSENRRLTRHQKSLIVKSFENSPMTPDEPVFTPTRRRRSSVVAGSEDELTPVRSSKRLQDKAHKKDG